MLTNLSISNIVLIEKLNLEFGPGLNILTGETGAGKSILLDALALALGARSDTGLVRHGCNMASVVAEFDAINKNLGNILTENGIEYEGTLILRRTLSCDGKSRAWVNDTPISIKTLKQIGDELVEIHGQFANHTLLNPSTHRVALDTFACLQDKKYAEQLTKVKNAYYDYHHATCRLQELQNMLDKSELEKDFLKHNIAELQSLNVQVGEEEELSTRRADMMNAEKNSAILSDACGVLSGRGESIDAQLYSAAHILERIKTAPNPYTEQIDALYNAAQTISDIIQKITPKDVDTGDLDSIEERLFTIRSVARKHHIPADELPQKLKEMTAQLNSIENSDIELQKLQQDVENKKAYFNDLAKELSVARTNSATELRRQILQELPELKLGQADFMIEKADAIPNATGCDDILFMIKTNPGTPFAPLHKSASGGELARLMLALRVVLSGDQTAHTFIFDEVDTGISGATASAVGQRLKRLAHNSQALVITHSAQVAGFADKHFKIEKRVNDNNTITTVSEITNDERLNEIARIISGAKITPESLATAKTLIQF